MCETKSETYVCMLIYAYLFYFIVMAFMPFCLYDLWQWKTDWKVQGEQDWDMFMLGTALPYFQPKFNLSLE